MYEEYTTTSTNNGHDKLCPLCFGGPAPYGEVRCSGERCMAFVRELSPDGTPTGRGRCGMVQPIREMSVRDRARLARKS